MVQNLNTKLLQAIIQSQAGWNKGDSQKVISLMNTKIIITLLHQGMTGFGAPRDVKGKHLKRIWELVRSRNLFVEKKQTTNICRSTPRRLKSHWTVFKQKRRSSDSAQIISRKFLTSQYHAKPILKTKTFHHQLDNFMLYQFLNSRFLQSISY